MNVYVCIRTSRLCKPGEFFIGNPDDGLFLAKKERTGKTAYRLKRSSIIPLPFNDLAPFIIPYGFSVTIDRLPRETARDQGDVEFQNSEDAQEIIEGELKKRERRADPSYSDTWKESPPLCTLCGSRLSEKNFAACAYLNCPHREND